jgi:hypothetical protein
VQVNRAFDGENAELIDPAIFTWHYPPRLPEFPIEVLMTGR